jgi:hypothetical protein
MVNGRIFLLFFAVSVLCSVYGADLETSGLQFMTIPVDARSTALGGSSTLLPSAQGGHWGNPALAAAYNRPFFTISYSPYIADISLGGLSGTFLLRDGLTLSQSLRYLSVGIIEGYDENGVPLDQQVSPFSFDAGTAASYQFRPEFSAGLQMRIASEYLSPSIPGSAEFTSAAALTFDAGIYYEPSRAAALSAGFRNAGWYIRRFAENDTSSLPLTLFAGIRYHSRGTTSMNLLLEAEKELYSALIFRPGMEIILYREIVSIRFGTAVSTDDISHFMGILGGSAEQSFEYSKTDPTLVSLGAGVKVPFQENLVHFDFASKILGDGIGLTFCFTGGISF